MLWLSQGLDDMPSPLTLMGTNVPMFIHAVIQSASHVAGTQCIKSYIKMGKGVDVHGRQAGLGN